MGRRNSAGKEGAIAEGAVKAKVDAGEFSWASAASTSAHTVDRICSSIAVASSSPEKLMKQNHQPKEVNRGYTGEPA